MAVGKDREQEEIDELKKKYRDAIEKYQGKPSTTEAPANDNTNDQPDTKTPKYKETPWRP